ncbi:hypothetical protein EPH_0066840 [Eimeria praecox]|uniref:Uncharacterized protein n=1 Tax=Eimeria praecox TaxID=51316 RepID=U6H090_9EIME|nr:hypothetical protein EPH_0066840 [Eimeria praecox]
MLLIPSKANRELKAVIEGFFASGSGDEDEEWGAGADVPAEDEGPVDEDTLFGPPDPPVTVGRDGARSRARTMELVLQRVAEAENSPEQVDNTDETLGVRLRHAADCRRGYKNVEFDETVSEELRERFGELLGGITEVLWRTSGRTRESDSK